MKDTVRKFVKTEYWQHLVCFCLLHLADEQYYLDLTHEEEDGDEDGIVATCVRFSKKRKRPHVSFGIANASGHLEPGDIIEVDSGESSPTLVANGSISSSGAVMDLTYVDDVCMYLLREPTPIRS